MRGGSPVCAFSSLCNTVFIACGETLPSRASSALDNPGLMESIRMQTNSGSVRLNGLSAAATSGRRVAIT